MRLLKLLLFLLAFYRLFIAVTFEGPLLVGWPVSNLATECKATCPTAWQSELCFKHCELRQKMKLDLVDYEKVDPLFSSVVSTFKQKVAMGFLVGASVLLFLVSIGNLFGSICAKKWGLFFAGTIFQFIGPYTAYVVSVSSNPQTFLLYNICDFLLIPVLLLNGWCNCNRKTEPESKAAEARTGTKKKTEKQH